jgi:hypothetical protein
MNTAYVNSHDFSFFCAAKEQLNDMLEFLCSDLPLSDEHGAIEQYIQQQGHELLRRLLQGHLDLRAHEEVKQDNVVNPQAEQLTHFRANTTTSLNSLFGKVTVTRNGYNKRQTKSVFPLDTQLNLAKDQCSDGLRLQLAAQINHCAYDHVVEHIKDTTGGKIAKRQCLELVQDMAQDFAGYYQQNRYLEAEATNDLLVLTFDGKGIVMRSESLRACTKKKAQNAKKLNSRLSAGEKKDRKRMAQVASVYTVMPHLRSAESVMKMEDEEKVHTLKVPARNKRVWASVKRDARLVIQDAFEEALQRDPKQDRAWVVVIDGHPGQRKMIEKSAKQFKVNITIVLDFIHVLEYLWKAAWCFFDKGDEAVEGWVGKYAMKILKGHSSQVAKGLKQSATKRQLLNRTGVDACAKYLLNNTKRLRYDVALSSGFPIASGIIEGACRHLINDRLDITGARWCLEGAEALLKLRSLKSSGHFDDYWLFHKQQSKNRLYG